MSLWRPRARAAPAEARQGQIPMFGPDGPLVPLHQHGFADLDLDRIDTSLQSVAVRTAADLIASLASELPVHVFRGRGADREELRVPQRLEDPDGSGYGLEDWSYQALMSWLLRGNVYGDILETGPNGILGQVELFHPDKVHGWVEGGEPVWSVAGQRFAPRSRFLHRRVNPIPGVIQGMSPVSYHASQIGVSLSAMAFGDRWFKDGGHPSAILESTERDVTESLAKTVKQRFLAAVRGTREPVVLDRGWKYQAIQVNPDESQFLETMGYSEAQCARMFGPGIAEVLGYSVKGASLTYSNLQDRDLHLLKYSLNRWLRRLERLLSEFLPRPQYVRLDRDALLETNTMQRYQAYASALSNRWMVVNEVRDREKLDPVAWGDRPNMTYTGLSLTADDVDVGAVGTEPNDEPVEDDD